MTQKQKKAIETARACKNCKVKEDLVIEKGKTTTITDENGKVTHKTASDKQWDFCSVNTCKKHSRLFFD